MNVNFLSKFPQEENFLLFVLKPNDKLNNYRDIIKLIQKEKLLNHIILSNISPLRDFNKPVSTDIIN